MRPTCLRVWVCAAWLVFLSNGVLFWIARRLFDRPGSWEDPIVRPTIVLSVGAAVAMVVLDEQRVTGARLREIPLVPFVSAVALGVWAATTTLWSLEPETTLWRGVVYAFLPFAAWVIADLPARQFRRALVLATTSLVTGSCLLVALGVPDAIDANGDWQGLLTNRNSFAPICALAVIAGISLAADREWMRGCSVAVIGLLGLAGSGGRTAAVALLVAVVIATLVAAMRRAHLQGRTRMGHNLAAGAIAGGGLVLLGIAAWNQPTFAQRREIWRLVGAQIADAPLIGSGWAAFWRHPQLHDEPLLRLGSAHGSVPELLLGGGVVALTLWLVVCASALGGAVRRVLRSPDNEAWLWLAVVLFLMVENLTESFVLWFSYNWVVLIAASLRFGSGRKTARPRSPSAGADIRLVNRTVAPTPRNNASG